MPQPLAAGAVEPATIASLQVGLPRLVGTADASDPLDRPWTTGFFKEPVHQPLWLGDEGLEGDGVADRKVHGGPEKAVLAYAASHYFAWEAELGFELPSGAFGENVTVRGQSEATVCIGDRYAVGTAIVEVSQPRQPCWKLARRWRIRTLAARVQETGRTGWYLRVRQTGRVTAGDSLILIERPYPEWTVAAANAVMHGRPTDRAAAEALAACPALAANWRTALAARSATGTEPDTRRRLVGPNDPAGGTR